MKIETKRTRDLLFIRHGETDWNAAYRIQSHSDVGLNELGQQQMSQTAEAIGASLGDRSWKGPPSIWSSPIARAQESAAIVQGTLGAAGYEVEEIQLHAGLSEFDMGEFTGRTIMELQSDSAWAGYLRSPTTATFPGGESMVDIRARVRAAVFEILDADDADATLIVTHGGIVRIVIHDILSLPESHFHSVHVQNASVTHLRLMPPAKSRLLAVNWTPSIAPIL